jgi:acyl carrier protein
LYKTGDLGRYLPDGNIEFLGREDFQVKVQGYRIELGEIEAVISRHPCVQNSAVQLAGEQQDNKYLVAYIVANQKVSDRFLEELRQHLKQQLPDYMIPSSFMMLDNLPLTANGKLDRRSLPQPTRLKTTPCVENYQAEITGITAEIAKLIASILAVDRIDINVSLLELGANSVDIVRIVNLLEKHFHIRQKIDDLVQFSTVAALGLAVEQQIQEHSKNSANVSDDWEEGTL